MKQRLLGIINEVQSALDLVPEIIHVGDPVLRKPTQPVSLEEAQIISKQLVAVLDKYKANFNVGAGLAAPQIGILKSVFVTITKKGTVTYINPKVTQTSPKTNFYRESCLSSRVMWSDIKRPQSITLSWTDEFGHAKTENFSGFMARLIQHEYDHLEGIMCLDKSETGSIEYCGDVSLERIRETR